jgi:hypothetical protein
METSWIAMNSGIDVELADYLERLAGGILPLKQWVSTKTYKPPSHEKLPWRSSPQTPLEPARLGLIRFLEGLLLETSNDEEIKAHFATRAEEPLKLAPHDDTSAWRALRGFKADPEFGVADSDNLLMDVEGHPISRAGFYRVNLPLFRAAAELALETAGGDDVDWQKFADDLLNNKSPFWPRSLPRRSSTFLKQFGRDLLYAVLGMRNPVEEPWKHAVLIELGEHRRVGNLYTPDDAAKALNDFLAVFDEPAPQPSAIASIMDSAAVSSELVPPIGSPAVTPRQQQI